MSVEVRFVGSLVGLTNKNSIPIQLNQLPKPTILTVIQHLSKLFGKNFEDRILEYHPEGLRLRVLVLKNDVEIRVLNGLETEVNPGDKIVFIPISHGG